ncbi:hypothetical protein [Actinoplanes palleronii]|nr:hypothetical protein [Actinoplanes palleronii]
MFSVAQHEAVIAEINEGMNTLNAKLDQAIPAADRVASQWWVADVIGEALMYIARETVELGKEIVAFIADLLKGAVAPIIMFQDSWKWADIKSGFSGVATELSDTNLIIDDSK